MAVFTVYPTVDTINRVIALLAEAEVNVQQAGEPPPAVPYVRFDPGGWELRDRQPTPTLVTAVVHAYDPTQSIAQQALPAEALVVAALQRELVFQTSPPAQPVEFSFGNRKVMRLVTALRWRMR